MSKSLFERFEIRAKTALANADELTNELLELALNESNEACKNRAVPDFARLDIAFVRLKLYLKIELVGEDELLLKNALEVVEKSPFLENEATCASKFYKSGVREDEYC